MSIRQAARSTLCALTMAVCGAYAAAPVYTADDYKRAVAPCLRARDYDCAQKNWTSYLKLRPTDTQAMANLGIVMNMRDDHAGAIVQFEKAIDMGEGTYDLFAYYADSLAKLGRTDDAIDWSYRSLAVWPQLVDVRGKLAKLLVAKQRHHEALALLAAHDDDARARGQAARFEGQRIAIESAIDRLAGAATPAEKASIRAPKYRDHFFAPVSLGGGKPGVFVVDTGAGRTTVSEEFLAASKAEHKVTIPSITMVTADGRHVRARGVTVASMKVGPFELKQAPVVVCAGCVLLLGQSALSKFDLKSTKSQGVEFLTLSPRLH
jgi:predicted aspartyl protease